MIPVFFRFLFFKLAIVSIALRDSPKCINISTIITPVRPFRKPPGGIGLSKKNYTTKTMEPFFKLHGFFSARNDSTIPYCPAHTSNRL